MAYNGAWLRDADGKVRRDSTGKVAHNSACDIPCGTVGGSFDVVSGLQTPSGTIFCECCQFAAWDIVIAGATSTGDQNFEHVQFTFCFDEGWGYEPPAGATTYDLRWDTLSAELNGTSSFDPDSFEIAVGADGERIPTGSLFVPATISQKEWVAQDVYGFTSDGVSLCPNICPGAGSAAGYPGTLLESCFTFSQETSTISCARLNFSTEIIYNTAGDPTSGVKSFAWIASVRAPDYGSDQYASEPRTVIVPSLFYGKHVFTAAADGSYSWDCKSDIVFSRLADPEDGQPGEFGTVKIANLTSGGTLTLRPCASSPPRTRSPLCTTPKITTAGTCVSEWSCNSLFDGTWGNWTLVSGPNYYAANDKSLPQKRNQPIITKDVTGCHATYFKTSTPDVANGCPATSPPDKLTSACKQRFQCAKVWVSYHDGSGAAGWSTPVAVTGGGVFCIDTENEQTPLDAWGPLQEGCKEFYYQSLGHACEGTDDTVTCAGMDSTTVPPAPSADPGCLVTPFQATCTDCPDNKCDQYLFGADASRTVTGPTLFASNVDCPGTCQTDWVVDGAGTVNGECYSFAFVCHGAAAPSNSKGSPTIDCSGA